MRVVPIAKALVRARRCGTIDSKGKIFIPLSDAKVPVNDKGVWETGLHGPQDLRGQRGPIVPQVLVNAIPLDVIDSLLASKGFL